MNCSNSQKGAQTIQPIEKDLEFIVEIERLKAVQRKTKPVGLDRYENSAEHSWHVCLSALILKDYADEDIDINRVIKMLLVHDLGKIDAGDTIIYATESETATAKTKEAAGVARIFRLLPEGKADEYIALWNEFESGETADAKYARAIDRIPPLLHNLYGDGHSWKENNVLKEKVFSVNQHINKSSQMLWQIMEAKLQEAVNNGMLK